jgi:hypothetical protein
MGEALDSIPRIVTKKKKERKKEEEDSKLLKLLECLQE